MKVLVDFFPILLFFIAYKIHGIFVAVAVAMGASFIQIVFHWLKHRKLEKIHLITFVIVAISGGLTLAFQNEIFFKWKPSIVNWLFGIVFLASQFIGKKNIVERMMSSAITLPDYIWPRLNMAWSLFFIALGFANLYVMSNYDTNTWVDFKLFGMMGLTLAFMVIQGIYLARYIQDEPAEEVANNNSRENAD